MGHQMLVNTHQHPSSLTGMTTTQSTSPGDAIRGQTTPLGHRGAVRIPGLCIFYLVLWLSCPEQALVLFFWPYVHIFLSSGPCRDVPTTDTQVSSSCFLAFRESVSPTPRPISGQLRMAAASLPQLLSH